MTERSKYEKWLRDLDGSGKSADVVERVRADYTTRLQSVNDQLRAQHDLLKEHAANLTSQLQTLLDSEKKLTDAMAEGDIRKQVGELSEADFLTMQKSTYEQLAKLKENQQVVAGDINRIREMLGGSDKTATPRPAGFNELSFLTSVVGSSTPPKPRASAATPKPATADQPAQPAPVAEAPAAQPPRTSGAIKPMPPPPRPSVVKPMLVEQEGADSLVSSRPVTGEVPLASNVPDSKSIELKAKGVPSMKKTLRCPECGALNNPSEWYCERCGAELAKI